MAIKKTVFDRPYKLQHVIFKSAYIHRVYMLESRLFHLVIDKRTKLRFALDD